MNTWYAAKLLFESSVDDGSNESPLLEESIRVLQADSVETAQTKALEIGSAAEHSYLNELGQSVRWAFVSLLELQDLRETELADGTEIFSRLYRRDSSGA